jgi:hypothetical protein
VELCSSSCKSPLSHLQAIQDFRSSHILDSVHSPNFLQRPKKKKIAKITLGLRNNVVIFLIPNCSIWNLFQTAFLLAPSFAQVPKIKIFLSTIPYFWGKIYSPKCEKIWSFSITFLLRVRFGNIFSNSFFFAVCIDSKNLSPFSSKSLLECWLLTNNQKIEEKTLILIHVWFFLLFWVTMNPF